MRALYITEFQKHTIASCCPASAITPPFSSSPSIIKKRNKENIKYKVKKK